MDPWTINPGQLTSCLILFVLELDGLFAHC